MKKHLFTTTAILMAAGALLAGDAPSAVSAEAKPAAAAVAPAAVATVAVVVAQPTIPVAKPADPWAKFKHLTFDEAKKLYGQKRILFVDTRPKSEYDQSHIPGAIPVPLGEFDKYYEMYKVKIHKSKKLISYCHGIGCHLSDKVAEKLYDKGNKNTYVFFGGWPQWTQNNMPVEGGDGKLLPTPTAVTPAAAPAAK